MAHSRKGSVIHSLWADEVSKVILGCQFTVRTDHKSLEWLFNAKSGRLCRWALLMSEYLPFEIRYRDGSRHTNVDALTRDFAESDTLPEHATLCAILLSVDAVPRAIPFPTREQLIQAQASDPGCRSLIEATKAVVREKVLGLGRKDAWRPMLPAALVEEVARSLHGHPLGAHLCARRLLSSLSKHYVITNGLPLVQKVTNGCLRCRQRKLLRQQALTCAVRHLFAPRTLT